MWITCVPLAWLVTVTYTVSWQQIFSSEPRSASSRRQTRCARRSMPAVSRAAQIAATQAQLFNNRLDAVICGIFVVLVTAILADSLRCWGRILLGGRRAEIREASFVLTRLSPEEA
jgi:carbon starvation protein